MTAEKPETKRARRKLGANPAQLWPQMPKVKTPAARANASLRVAGLSTKIVAPPIDPQLDLMNAPEIKFGRLLASPEQRVRHEAVRRLNQYLSARCVIGNDEGVGLSELDLLKLWKGLWHTLYMADRVPVQDELSKHLAEMIWCVAGTEEEDEYAGKMYLDMYGMDDEEEDDEEEDGEEDDEDGPGFIMEELVNTTGEVYKEDEEEEDEEEEEENEGCKDEGCEDEHHNHDDEEEEDESLIPHCRGAHLAALFVKTFFQTVRREWGHMDKYRVDKFYTLIRLMMEQVYEYMAKRHWNLGIIRLFNDTIYEEVLSQTPNGLRLHVIDLALQELAKVNNKAPMPLTEATLIDCLEPYLAMSQTCDDKVVQARVVEKVLCGFLENYSVICEAALAEEEEDDNEESIIMDQVHIGTVADFIFSLASDSATREHYRPSLYATYKDYKRRLKQVGKDVALEKDGAEDDSDDAEEEMDEDDQVRVVEVDDPANFEGDDDAEEQPLKKSKVEKGNKKRGHAAVEEKEEQPTKTSKSKVEKGNNKRGRAAVEEEEPEVEKKSPKKKKKAKAEAVDDAMPKEPVDDTTPTKSSKKKKNKKAKEDSTVTEEEVITISVADQKRAKQAAAVVEVEKNDAVVAEEPKKLKKKKRKESEDEKEARRVSFGKVNHSKSHKASMKALRTMENPKILSMTPEKSILHKKTPASADSSKSEGKKGKKSRKKAADYF